MQSSSNRFNTIAMTVFVTKQMIFSFTTSVFCFCVVTTLSFTSLVADNRNEIKWGGLFYEENAVNTSCSFCH
jgi:hypothetical protein